MSAREHMHGVVAALQPVVHGVPETAMSASTPCEEFDVRALVSHLLGTTEALRRYGAGEPPDPQDPWGTKGAEVTDDWRTQLGQRLQSVADAWAPADAWEGHAFDGVIPSEMLFQTNRAEGSHFSSAFGLEERVSALCLHSSATLRTTMPM